MKKSIVIFLLMFAVIKTQAQDYLISFAGAGDTNVVSTVKVDNLTSGATVTLNGEDTLHLTAAVGIGHTDFNPGTLQVFPNPVTGQSVLTFSTAENGTAAISLIDLSGKTIYQLSTWLSSGVHFFRIYGIGPGIFFIKVTGKNYDYFTKLVSQSNFQSNARIEYISSVKASAMYPLKSISGTVDMPYTEGDQLLFTGTSGIYSALVTDVPATSKTITFNFALCTDIDGNNYATVQIGTGKTVIQTWMAENLKVTHYSDGSPIPYITDPATWYSLTTGAYTWYTNDTSYKVPYGALYNWYAVDDSRNPCPAGWHVPTDVEFTILVDFLGGDSIAGGKLKSVGNLAEGTGLWTYPNTGATNESGFSALPAGLRFSYGQFAGINDITHYWTATEYDTDYAYNRYLYHNGIDVYRLHSMIKKFGLSVRCMKD